MLLAQARHRRLVEKALCLLTLATLVQAGLSPKIARGATYNFYFNNTEQGDNSTAAPSVQVNDGKGGTPGVPTPDGQPAGGVNAAPGSGGTSGPNDGSLLMPLPPSYSRFRLAGMYGQVRGSYERSFDAFRDATTSSFDIFNPPKIKEDLPRSSVGVGMTAFFHPHFGVTLNLGTLTQVEGEWSLLGRGSVIEPALLLGATSRILLSSFDWFLAPHVGARVSINLGRDIGLSVAGRIAGLGGSTLSYRQVEAGLVVNF